MKKDISEKTVLPCYLLYGEESYLADEFVSQLNEALSSLSEEDLPVERMDLSQDGWIDVLDMARTVPFFFTAWRLIEVKVSKSQANRLSDTEIDLIKSYLDSPTQRTVLIFVISEKMKKKFQLLECLSSFPSSIVLTKELKELKGKNLYSWVDRRLARSGKNASQEAIKRLVELSGTDLAILSSEIEKLVTFVDDKKVIELDDVYQVSGLLKTFNDWEMANCLEKSDYTQGVIVLNKLLKKSSASPQYILGALVKFFRDILIAKLWLKEGQQKSAVFKALYPHLLPHFTFYREKFLNFFTLTEAMSMSDLNRHLSHLNDIDLKLKTSDMNPQILIESFLYDYCCEKEKGSTLKELP